MNEIEEKQFHFSAGSYGKVYGADISIEHMKRCWKHPEYQCICKNCGHTAYVYSWAGHCTGGGYWMLKVWCPECNNYHHYHLVEPKPISSHWTKMRKIIENEALSSELHDEKT